MGIKEVLGKFLKKDTQFSEMEQDFRRQKKLEARQKNSNERELERYEEEERQEMINRKLAEFRKQRQRELFKTTVLNNDHNILDNQNNILKQENIFEMKSNMLGKGMFFK